MKQIVILILILLASDAFADGKIFYRVSEDTSHLLCPCEFKESGNNVKEGSYGSGETVLIIAANEKQPFALINFSGSLEKLEPMGALRYNCKKGEIYSPQFKKKSCC